MHSPARDDGIPSAKQRLETSGSEFACDARRAPPRPHHASIGQPPARNAITRRGCRHRVIRLTIGRKRGPLEEGIAGDTGEREGTRVDRAPRAGFATPIGVMMAAVHERPPPEGRHHDTMEPPEPGNALAPKPATPYDRDHIHERYPMDSHEVACGLDPSRGRFGEAWIGLHWGVPPRESRIGDATCGDAGQRVRRRPALRRGRPTSGADGDAPRPAFRHSCRSVRRAAANTRGANSSST